MIDENFIATSCFIFPDGFFSEEILKKMNSDLSKDFFDKTGIPSRSKDITLVFHPYDFRYERKIINDTYLTIFKFKLSVNNFGFMVIVHFTQFSYGTLPITPFSKIFNEDEIEFRFDELPIEDIQKEYSKNVFDRKKIRKDLPFEFEVDNSIGQSFYFVIYHNLPDDEIIEKKMESTFNSWNSKLEKSNSISPIHNLIKEKFLPSKYSIFYLDLGYTGFKALNLFLGNLQKIEEVSKVYLTVNCEDL